MEKTIVENRPYTVTEVKFPDCVIYYFYHEDDDGEYFNQLVMPCRIEQQQLHVITTMLGLEYGRGIIDSIHKLKNQLKRHDNMG